MLSFQTSFDFLKIFSSTRTVISKMMGNHSFKFYAKIGYNILLEKYMSLSKVLAVSKRHMGTYTIRDLFWIDCKKRCFVLIDHMRADNHRGNFVQIVLFHTVIHYYKIPLNTIENSFFTVKVYRNMDKILSYY